MKEIWTTLASIMGVWAFFQSLMHNIFPAEIRLIFQKTFNQFINYFSVYCYYEITEIDGVNTNELYDAVQLYLSTSASIAGNRLSLTRLLNSSALTFSLSNHDRVVDNYKNVPVVWEHFVMQRQSQTISWRPLPEDKRVFTLRVKKKDKSIILDSYLDFIMEKANELKRKNQDRLIYTNSGGGVMDPRGMIPWESVPFKHPSTFDTLAMDPGKKAEILDDLLGFAKGESFYQRTGRAWKRGYLLYGPPGTGKSSMIAAMANFLGYDIYDLELTGLLMKTSSKSIIVIEDIDCSINLTNRNDKKNDHVNVIPGIPNEGIEDMGNKITLSGLLNFSDGLWSCCGSERIFVFITNHVEKIDPALLRSGRMDMHIHMSYCSFPALKILLKNYLGFDDEGGNIKELEDLIEKQTLLQRDVSEFLIKNRKDNEKANERTD
ncbi:hypothetical protein Leryth_009459 [Lithospermum erythrorhizon]|nr:hypothetical protein Leryth_009459 [Lithospermum erythrorhizon]